jgi:hypothetical protein
MLNEEERFVKIEIFRFQVAETQRMGRKREDRGEVAPSSSSSLATRHFLCG